MKCFLIVFLGLFSFSLTALDFSDYLNMKSKPEAKAIISGMGAGYISSEVLNNVVICEYLAHKFFGINYSSLIHNNDIYEILNEWLSPLENSGWSSITSSYLAYPDNADNVVTLEYRLRQLFGYSYEYLLTLGLIRKKQLLYDSDTSYPELTHPAVSSKLDTKNLERPINDLASYKAMIARDASNDEILTALLAPLNLPTDNILYLNEIPIDSRQGINNMEIVNYLLHTKFKMPQATLDIMFPYHKMIDVVRQLLGGKRVFEIKYPTTTTVYTTYPKPADRHRDATFSRPWIEFPSPNRDLRRHLDYSAGYSDKIYLMDSNSWNYDKNDFSTVNAYYNVKSYYWTLDGARFLLVYNDGTSKLYDGLTGKEVTFTEQAPILADFSKILDSAIDTAKDNASDTPESSAVPSSTDTSATPTTSAPIGNTSSNRRVIQKAGETIQHAILRTKATLATTGRLDAENVLANAIAKFDTKSYNEITDRDINELRKIEENDSVFNFGPLQSTSLSLMSATERAALYIALALSKIDNDALKEGLDSFATRELTASTSDRTGIKIFNSDLDETIDQLIIGQALSGYELTESEQAVIIDPNKYIGETANLLRANPTSATQLAKAKMFILNAHKWLNPEHPRVIIWQKELIK